MINTIWSWLENSATPVQVELFLMSGSAFRDGTYILEGLARRAMAATHHDQVVGTPHTDQSSPAPRPAHMYGTASRLLELEQERASIEAKLTEARAAQPAADVGALGRDLQVNAVKRADAYDENRRERSPVTAFVSYAHEDERYARQLLEAMAGLRLEGLVRDWHDRRISPGEDWAQVIDEAIENSDLVLLIVSSSFLSSAYCTGVEMKRALELHETGRLVLVPVIARPSDWRSLLGRFQSLPTDGKPISTHPNADAAYLDVVLALRKLIKSLRGRAGQARDRTG